MACNPAKHHRRSIRLKGYDYSKAGLYFITINTQNRACLFGTIENGEMILNDAGMMVENEWLKLSGTGKTVGDMVGAFESITMVEYIRGVKTNNWQLFNKKLWQCNYHEHIIRNEQSYIKISEYIVNNPANWDNDSLNKFKYQNGKK